MRSLEHWTPKYAIDRSLNIISNLAHPNWPWLTPAAVRFLESRLKPGSVVFEWGAGRSTLWIARRVKEILSVEHDPVWFRKIQSRAIHRGLNNLRLRLIAGESNFDQLGRYVNAVREAPNVFDLIVVDGLHRDRCALAALTRIKPGGIILVDNANWYLPSTSRSPASRKPEQRAASPEWAEFQQQVAGWPAHWTSNGVTDTAIWVSPAEARCDLQTLSVSHGPAARLSLRVP